MDIIQQSVGRMYKDWLIPLGLGALLALVLGAIVIWGDRKFNRPAEMWHGSALLAWIHPSPSTDEAELDPRGM
jgi:hypothetical protein